MVTLEGVVCLHSDSVLVTLLFDVIFCSVNVTHWIWIIIAKLQRISRHLGS